MTDAMDILRTMIYDSVKCQISPSFVIPAKAGIQIIHAVLDYRRSLPSRRRGRE